MLHSQEDFSWRIYKDFSSEQHARFYAAQIVLVFEYLYYLDVLYRDLKPENLLIDADDNFKVTDFGFAKIVKDDEQRCCARKNIIKGSIGGHSMFLVCEMSAGHSPFHANDQAQICQKIPSGELQLPPYFTSDLEDLLSILLQVDVTKRYGNLKNGVADIKTHQWFYTTDRIAIFQQKVKSPYAPKTKGFGYASSFDAYKEEPLHITATERFGKEFEEF